MEDPECAECGTTVDIVQMVDFVDQRNPSVTPWLCESCRRKIFDLEPVEVIQDPIE